MEPVSIKRPIDDLGRVAIPPRLREKFDLQTGDTVDFYLDNGQIVIKKHFDCCYCCGKKEDLVELLGLKIYAICSNELNQAVERITKKEFPKEPLNKLKINIKKSSKTIITEGGE